jgi:hypothetical protein
MLTSNALSTESWQGVLDDLARLESFVVADDARGVRAIVAELEGNATRLARIAKPSEDNERETPMPDAVLLRRNRLIHELDLRLEVPGGDTTADR